METPKDITPDKNHDQNEVNSFKGALFSSVVFVGGGIVLFMALLFVMYTIRM